VPTNSDGPRPSNRSRPRRNRAAALLLLIPLVGTLVPSFYNSRTPSIGGMPFFYWYQLAWVVGVAICTGIVYAATRNSR